MCLETVSTIICSVTFLGTDARLITYSSQILLLVLEDSGGNCFLTVLRSFSQLLWPFKGNHERPHNGINQFIQHLLVYPTKSHGVLYVPFKHFIVQSSSTKGKYSLLPTLPHLHGLVLLKASFTSKGHDKERQQVPQSFPHPLSQDPPIPFSSRSKFLSFLFRSSFCCLSHHLSDSA